MKEKNHKRELYGLLAQFEGEELLLDAAQKTYAEGYRDLDAFSPYPVDGLAEALGRKGSIIPLLTLLGGVAGGASGYLLQYFAMAVDYPLNIGGRPLNSWPQFIPVTFELTILCAAGAAFLSALILNRFPEPYHPLFNSDSFPRATQDGFFLCIGSSDPKFEVNQSRHFLAALGASLVEEVEK